MEKTNNLLLSAVIVAFIMCSGVLFLLVKTILSNESTNEQVNETTEIENSQNVEAEVEYVEDEEYEDEDISEVDITEESYDGTFSYENIPTYISEYPDKVIILDVARFDGTGRYSIDVGMPEGLMILADGFYEYSDHPNFGQTVKFNFIVDNLSEKYRYEFQLKNVFLDDVYFEDDAYYDVAIDRNNYLNPYVMPNTIETLLLSFHDVSILRKYRYTPFPNFESHLYGELKIAVTYKSDDPWSDSTLINTYVLPFTLPIINF